MAALADYEVIVIGAGIEGSCTAYQLAKSGKQTLLIEQFYLPHTRGSSQGQSRIIRDNYEKDVYSQMTSESLNEWAEISEKSNVELFKQCNLLFVGEKSDMKATQIPSLMSRRNQRHKVLKTNEIEASYPMLQFKNADNFFILDYEAGILKANQCLTAVQSLFKKSGGVIKDGEHVTSIYPGKIVHVKTSKGIYSGRHLVITAGPWTSKLLKPLGLKLPLKPVRITLCYFKEKIAGTHDLEKLPIIISEGSGGLHVYTMPAFGYPNHVKIGYHYGPEIDPDTRDFDLAGSDKYIGLVCQFARDHFKYLNDVPSVTERCIYTMTPDADFILDRHPKFSNIVIGAGFSGHGFKMAPIVGKILSNLVEGSNPSYDLSLFKISRFLAPKSVL